MNFFYLFLLSVITIISYKIFIPLFKKKLFALPTSRGFHLKKKPTSGGIIFVSIFISYSLLNKVYLPLLSLPMSFVGLLDDKFNIQGIQKFLYQLITVSIITIYAVNSENSFLSQLVEGKPYIYLFLFFTGVAIINIVNFMDGIDGLISSNIFLVLLNYSLNNNLDLIAIPVVLLVFLYYNWHPAKIFMGDSGSTFLGLILFYITFSKNDFNSSLILLSTASPLLMDSCVCILRRFNNNENIFSPHKKHLYQRLHQKGMPHSKVSIIYASCTFILIIFSKTNNLIIMSSLTLLVFLVGIYLEKYWAIPFKS